MSGRSSGDVANEIDQFHTLPQLSSTQWASPEADLAQ
jgi:hypothetical protein